ncbi:MAG: PH domain-containing protein [Candidatus Dormibacteria bacterium]
MSDTPDRPWQRLHPLSPVIQLGRSAVAVMFVLALPYISNGGGQHSGDYFDVVVIGLAAIGGLISWLVTKWCVEGGTLRVETGLIRRRHTQVPLSRIQSVDVVRPALARIFGLAEVRVRTGVARNGDARLAYVAEEEAETIRGHLLAWSHGVTVEEARTLEQPLAAVRNRRLFLAVWLQGVVPVEVLLALGFLTAALIAPTTVGRSSLLGTAAVWMVLLVVAVGNRLNSQLAYEVADAPDGLRIRGGLIGTVVETLPKERIQALRQIEPLWWRPFGWVRVDADVAGGQRRKGEDRGMSGQLRILLPVATREEAARFLAEVAPGVAPPLTKAPSRAHLKTPLSYHFLAVGLTPGWGAATTGRLRRVTTWVALNKVQSVRWSQGPVQRRLRLATIHLDVAGRRVGVSLRDRDSLEAHQMGEAFTDLCMAARDEARCPVWARQQSAALLDGELPTVSPPPQQSSLDPL